MTDKDFKLIDDAINNKLNDETLASFNAKMHDKEFRSAYLNYFLDDALIADKLDELQMSETKEVDDDLSRIYDALNKTLGDDEFESFNDSLKDSEFRGEYLDFVLDDGLLEQTLEKKQLSPVDKKPLKFKVLSSALLTIAAVIVIFLYISVDESIVNIDRVYQASVIKDGREVKIGKRTVLKVGDHIKVKGSMTIVYPDLTEVTINNNSELILGDIQGKPSSRFKLLKGYLTVNASQSLLPIEVSTSQSKALFSGSTFTLSFINDFSTLEVHRGEVEFHNNFGSNDLVLAGQQAWVKEDQEVLAQQVYIDNENKKFTF
ncbi:MAG: FecR family protein [Lentisphaeraceae bacterium]|nr:FecR family protein [Lentisphaeraceae bacterium]